MPDMYRSKHDPKIVVQKVGEGFIRMGAKVKFQSVSYLDAEGKTDSRPLAEFQQMFERCE